MAVKLTTPLLLLLGLWGASAAPSNSTSFRCYKRAQLNSSPYSACPQGTISHGRTCHEYMTIVVQDHNRPTKQEFLCLMPENVNDILLAHTSGIGCVIMDHDTRAVAIRTGTVSCPPGPNYFSSKCVLYKQIISGCYSYALFDNLKLDGRRRPAVPFSLKKPPTDKEKCSMSFADIDCTKSGEEYEIFGLEKRIPEKDGALFYLPVGLNTPVDCSQFVPPAQPRRRKGLQTCGSQGPRTGACILPDSEWPRLLVPTVPQAPDGSCPRGFCQRLCTCSMEGTDVEISKCAVGSLFDFPEKPKK